jgi:hypothetical protein
MASTGGVGRPSTRGFGGSTPGRGRPIFISYRRRDSAGYAGRLYDALAARFGREQIFMDVDAIPPGVDFERLIAAAVQEAQVFLAVIGPQWLTVSASDGQPRIDDPTDYVHLEIETALAAGMLVIPVLLPGTEMPSPSELPEGIRPFARLNGVELSDSRWAFDVERLSAVVQTRVGSPSRTAGGRAAIALRRVGSTRTASSGVLKAGVAGLAIAALAWASLTSLQRPGGITPSSSPGPSDVRSVPSPSGPARASGTPSPAAPTSAAIVVPTGNPTATGEPSWPSLEPGRYHFTNFLPDLSMEIDTGWSARRDKVDVAELSHDTVPAGYLDLGHVQVALATPCPDPDAETLVLGSTAADLMAWLKAHESLTSDQVYPVNLGGLSGLRLDVSVPADLEIDCRNSEELPRVRLFLLGEDTLALLPGEKARVFALDHRDGRIVIVAGAESGDLDAFLPLADEVLNSIRLVQS